MNTETQEKLNNVEKFLGKTIETLEEKIKDQLEEFEKSILNLVGEEGLLFEAFHPNAEDNVFEAFQTNLQDLLSLEWIKVH